MRRSGNALRDARKVSALTQVEMGQRLGGITGPAVASRERRPGKMALEDIGSWYLQCNPTGREWIRSWVESFFRSLG